MKITVNQLKELANKPFSSYKINQLIIGLGNVAEVNLEDIVDRIDANDISKLLSFEISNNPHKEKDMIFDLIKDVSYAWRDYAKMKIPIKFNFIEEVLESYDKQFDKISKEEFNYFIEYHKSFAEDIIKECDGNLIRGLGDIILLSLIGGKNSWQLLADSIRKDMERVVSILKAIHKLINHDGGKSIVSKILFDIQCSAYDYIQQDKNNKNIILKYFKK
jgi:hypothetical protein